jgi:NAD(P)-dependent dehydrogenase (short-subunit alcohol dehydrogenase family)
MDVPQPFDFSGSTAVVLGGASGLGLALAEGLAAHGAAVCITSRYESKVQTAASELAARFPGRCHGSIADATSERSMEDLRDAVRKAFGGALNIAVNSAGIVARNAIEDTTLEEWEGVQRANITGAFLFARAMSPLLKAAPWGRLINIASIFGSRTFPNRVSYASSKGAMLQLTRTLAVEWAKDGVTVNAISPGFFHTEMTEPVLGNPALYQRFRDRIPLGRFGEPNELVTACLFLASPASSFVTGADIVVDGGWLAT